MLALAGLISELEALTRGRTDHFNKELDKELNSWLLLIYSFKFRSAF